MLTIFCATKKPFASNVLCLAMRRCATAATANTISPINATTEVEYAKEVGDIMHEYEERSKRRQALIGTVVSDKCSKSITVMVNSEKEFKKYNKTIILRKKIMAHDEEEICGMGDLVRIVPCRPMSKKKRHMIIDVLRKGNVLEANN